jgi:hypothetical protein
MTENGSTVEAAAKFDTMGMAPHSTVCRAIATIASQPTKPFVPRRIEPDVLAEALPSTRRKALSPLNSAGSTASALVFS